MMLKSKNSEMSRASSLFRFYSFHSTILYRNNFSSFFLLICARECVSHVLIVRYEMPINIKERDEKIQIQKVSSPEHACKCIGNYLPIRSTWLSLAAMKNNVIKLLTIHFCMTLYSF
jgi:hypothetical protein